MVNVEIKNYLGGRSTVYVNNVLFTLEPHERNQYASIEEYLANKMSILDESIREEAIVKVAGKWNPN